MPEGPELHLASVYVNRVCEGVVFSGAVRKSEVSKSPEVPFSADAFHITAASRGKEVKLSLAPVGRDEKAVTSQGTKPMDVVFRFGMSGLFKMTAEDEMPKHAHLSFYTKEKPRRVLSFVDTRRFGTWHPHGTWQPDRGPCVMFEYKSFRENVMSRLSDRAFDRPICEVLLNQKYFNGIGNYLRAEILFRLNIPPFECARSVLSGLDLQDPIEPQELMADTKKTVKQEEPDLLRLCHTVPLEVVNQGGKGYDPEKADYSEFEAWLQCYYVDGMKSLRDGNGRTIWFSGNPGPLVPKGAKSPKAKKRIKKEEDHDYTEKKKPARSRSNTTENKTTAKKTDNKIIKKEQEAESKKGVKKVQTTAEEQKKKKSTAEEQKKKSTAEEQKKKKSTAEEQKKKKSTAEEQKKKKSTAEEQKKSTAEEQKKKKSTAEEQKKKKSTAEEQKKKKSTAEEQKKKKSTAGPKADLKRENRRITRQSSK